MSMQGLSLREKVATLWQRMLPQPEFLSYDRILLLSIVCIALIGFVMVASASMPVAAKLFGNPYHIVIRHAAYLVMAMALGMIVLMMPMSLWQRYNAMLLLIALGMLVMVLIVGRTVNGSTRWIVLGPINIQAAEPAKLFFFAYLSGYLVRRYEEVQDNIKGFIKPLVVFFVAAVLLLVQPDLGTVVVMFVTTVSLLFLAGAKLWQFFGLMLTGVAAIVTLIVAEPYRVRRVTSFLDPWSDPFGHGYQLTQSLMAYGRGDVTGQGLGNSVQKLEYLPEAHTDFIFAVIGEELGLIGVSAVLLLMLVIVVRMLKIGQQNLAIGRQFEGFFALAIGVWFSLQTAVNVGASAGLMPTKGLTFPFVSYGGSSLLVMAIAAAVVIRIDSEYRLRSRQTIPRQST